MVMKIDVCKWDGFDGFSKLNAWEILIVVGFGEGGQGRFGQALVMDPPVLDMDEHVQLEVLVPNIMLGAAHVDLEEETTLQILY